MWLSGRLVTICVQSVGHIQVSCAISILRQTSQIPVATNIRNCLQARNISSSVMRCKLDANLNALQMKKRPIRKKRIDGHDSKGYNVTAYATAEEYDLERLLSNIIKEDLYERKAIITSGENDFLHVTAKYELDEEPREIFFFREGSVVLWNCPELECGNVLKQLSQFEIDSYEIRDVQDEKEWMPYDYADRAHTKKSVFYLSQNDDTLPLEKYTFSNAMSTSVKLGIWEALLDKYIDSMAYVTEDLKKGTKIKITRADVLRKTGELFALRHLINLSSDLLDAPDFYWDRDELGKLYLNICYYFSIQRRTRVMNEKLNHCIELAELISSNLNDTHSVTLRMDDHLANYDRSTVRVHPLI